MGYLYRVGLAGNGQIFFCPANWGSIVGANTYSPLLTTDNFGSGFGQVRSTYLYNPRVVKVDPNFAADSSNDKRARRYQKSPDLEPHKLFAVDYMEQNSPAGGMPATQIAHIRERGWNVLFTDGSVQFSQNKTAYVAITTRLISDESHQSFWWYETAFNYLELDH